MARLRMIKPEFWSDSILGECSASARLLFIGTWSFADDHGGIDRSAKQLKAQIFPYDDFDIEPLIQELLNAGRLIEYQANGKKYLHIKNFTKHQKIDKPSQPRVPLYEDSPSIPRANGEDSPSAPRALASKRASRARVRSGSGEEQDKKDPGSTRVDLDPREECRALDEPSASPREETTEAQWRREAHEAMDRIQAVYPKGVHASNWTVALHHANCLVGDGLATWAELVDAVERYRACFTATQSNGMNIAAHNFFDPRKAHWSQSWEITTAADARLDSNIDAALTAEDAIFGNLPE